MGKNSTSQKFKHQLLSTELENVRHNKGVVGSGNSEWKYKAALLAPGCWPGL